MPRVKRGVTAHARHKKILALAKGFRGRRKNVFRIAKEAVMKAGQYAYRDRRTRKRVFRQLWIARINAASRELGVARILLHAIFGIQFLLGLLAYWSRLTTAEAPQPMPLMVWLTVVHTVLGAILFAFSFLVVLLCYRLVPRGGEVAATAASEVSTG